MKKHTIQLVLVCVVLAGAAMAAKDTPEMPKILANARFVYVTSYDGDQYNPSLLSEDRTAISRVQDSLQKWGKLSLTYRPEDADIVIVVQSRPSEDVMAVYDGHSSSDTYVWRVMGRGGLQKGETPLVTQFQHAFEKIAN